MTFLIDEHRRQLLRNGSPEHRDKNHFPVVKLFIPGTACTWLLTELDPDEPDIAFGLCDLGMGLVELGYLSINELESIQTQSGVSVECDFSFEGKYPLSIYTAAAREMEQITENVTILSTHLARNHKPDVK